MLPAVDPDRELATLKAAIDAHAIVAITDTAGVIRYVNDLFCEVSGYSRDELIGADHRIVNSAYHPREFMADLWRTIAASRIWKGEIRNRRKDGRFYWVDTVIVPLTDAAGRPTRYVSIRTDITRRKEMEQAIQAGQDQRYRELYDELRALFDSEPHCVKVVDGEGMLIDMNPAGLRMLQAETAARVLGGCVADFVVPADRAIYEGLHQRAMAGQAGTASFRIRGLHGEERWVESHAVPLPGPRADGGAVLSLTLDITGQRRAQEALRAQALMLDHIGEAVIATDAAGTVIYANRMAGELYGWQRNEMLGIPITQVTVPQQEVARAHSILQALQQGGMYRGEFRVRRKDGSTFDAHVTTTQFYGQDGRLAGLVGISYDLTERKQAERRIERHNRALQMLSRCNELVARCTTEQALLDEVCEALRAIGGFRMVQVAYALQNEARSFVLQAHAGGGAAVMSGLRASWAAEDPYGQGPAGEAVRTGEAVVLHRVTAFPQYAPWADTARALGYDGVACLPLADPQRCFGVLVLYFDSARGLAEDEQRLLRELANNVAFGIATLRAREEGRRIREASEAVAAVVASATGEDFFRELTAGLVRSLGADAGVVASVLGMPEGRGRTLAVVVRGRPAADFEFALPPAPPGDVLTPAWLIRRGAQDAFPDVPLLRAIDAQSCVGAALTGSAGKPIGAALLFFGRVLREHETVATVMRVFAARAAAEMERVEADRKVREQASLLDLAQDAILVRSIADWRITFWNRAAERLFGWQRDEVLGTDLRRLLQDGGRQIEAGMPELLAHGQIACELTLRNRSGKSFVVERRGTLVRDAHGRAVAVMSILTDISARKQAQAELQRLNAELEARVRERTRQLQEANGELEAFSYSVSHDLRSPLAAISGFAEVVRTESLDDRSRHALNRIRQSALRMNELIEGLLALAQLTRTELLCEDVDLSALGEAVLAEISAAEPRAGVTLCIQPGMRTRGDRRLLRQVLANLLANAWKFSSRREQASITFDSVETGDGPVYRVRDDGAGFDPAYADRLFGTFQRLHSSSEFPGTGIGLATVKRIVERHGGRVWAESPPEGGAVFSFTLPGC